MPEDKDNVYRENLRKRLGLGSKSTTENVEVTPEVEATPNEPQEQSNPEAESIINEVLQFLNDEIEKKHPPRMAKALWIYLTDNKDKIIKAMVGKAEKAEKSI
jgi:hypothetical protein